jgi:hypothetical protein
LAYIRPDIHDSIRSRSHLRRSSPTHNQAEAMNARFASLPR